MASSRLSKGLAGFAWVYGFFCLISPVIAWAAKTPIEMGTVVFYLGSAGLSLTAGYFGMRQRPWAYGLLGLLFVPQLVEVESADRIFSLVGPVAVRLAFALSSAPVTITVNLLAVLVVVAAGAVAMKRIGPSKEAAQEPA